MSLEECFGMHVIRRFLGKTYVTLYFSYTNFRDDFLKDMNFFLTVSFYEQGCQILNLENQSSKVLFSKKESCQSTYLSLKKSLLSVQIPKLSCQDTVIWDEYLGKL